MEIQWIPPVGRVRNGRWRPGKPPRNSRRDGNAEERWYCLRRCPPECDARQVFIRLRRMHQLYARRRRHG